MAVFSFFFFFLPILSSASESERACAWIPTSNHSHLSSIHLFNPILSTHDRSFTNVRATAHGRDDPHVATSEPDKHAVHPWIFSFTSHRRSSTVECIESFGSRKSIASHSHPFLPRSWNPCSTRSVSDEMHMISSRESRGTPINLAGRRFNS